MYLFLQGAPQIGKSTILRDALLRYENSVAGLMVQRLFKGGKVCGFRACVVDGSLPALESHDSEGLGNVFLHHRQSRPEALEEAVARAGRACAGKACKLIVLDEIGGIELLSNAFMGPLYAILALGKPCMGVIKSHENLTHTVSRINLPDAILQERDKLHRAIEAQGRVITVTKETLAGTREVVNGFVAAVLQNK